MMNIDMKRILRILVLGAGFFLILNLLARTPGIGYSVNSYKRLSGEEIYFGRESPKTAYKVAVYMNISYNPLLFLISYLSGDVTYAGETMVIIYGEEKAIEMAATLRVSWEVTKNLLWFITLSFVLALVAEAFILRVYKPSKATY